MQSKFAPIILGSYINSYAIVQELYSNQVPNITMLATHRNEGWYSNKLVSKVQYKDSADSLFEELEKLHTKYEKLVLYPTDDKQIEYLVKIYDKIKAYCFLPFNVDNVLKYADKYEQYKACERLGVPYPKTISLKKIGDLQELYQFPLPILIKPTTRKDLAIQVFRSLQIKTYEELDSKKEMLVGLINREVSFIASEIIPGDGSNIYAYVGYRNNKGFILNEWTGKKLSQYPNDYGIFASASNEAPEIVLEQGRRLLNGMDLFGINEPEFKYDSRDGKYKLMEINLRSMMWHRVGYLSGVYIQYTQWLDAIGECNEKQIQDNRNLVKYIYLQHEIINLLTRRKYIKTFRNNLSRCNKIEYAAFDKTDMKPIIFNFFASFKALLGQWLRRLNLR